MPTQEIATEIVESLLNFVEEKRSKRFPNNKYVESRLYKFYIKWSAYYNELILSNISIAEHLRGAGILTEICYLLKQSNIKFSVECPSPRLQTWCKKNKVTHTTYEGDRICYEE